MSIASIFAGIALFQPTRLIGDMVADVTIEEQHTDTLIITEHPVEQGASISDHAYHNPSELVLRVAWSNSSVQAGLGPGYVQEIYDQLLIMQAQRIPFNILTGKRSYANMLIRSIAVTTDQHTENALFVTLICREVIMVQTGTVTVPPASQSKLPRTTVPPTNIAPQQLQPAPNYNPGQITATPLP